MIFLSFGEKRSWVKIPRGSAAVKWSLFEIPLGFPGRLNR